MDKAVAMGTQCWAKFTLTIVPQVIALVNHKDIPFLRNLKLKYASTGKLNRNGLVYLYELPENRKETR